MKNKIIILSGGMDSVTLLHQEKENIKLAITFFYGQKHLQEISFAKKQCELLNIPHKVIDLSSIFSHMTSNLLLSGGEIPEGHYQDETMRSTVVPFRNGIFLSIAAGIAESNDCESVLIANHSGDHAIYPDCRPEFIESMDAAMGFGTYKEIDIDAPFTMKDKRDIALLGKKLGVDYSLTWTCYKGGDIHCGKCGSCTERKEALSGFDNTEYLK